ncbi:beta-glucosidase [Paenibacillus sp. J31TS4]|uniref:beta-N-acetylhexosaminidase n=1 Tax=Paenibacillus sp. J31TS4 TaxID=2807195 RepID=UPI001B10DB45|nr:beta-N-acetylhexosaminidase [Paenibacillus sp. J31TS4]GIP38764.1 beta-glucosidase [Paenibacillus sp. J31TS4]
MDIRSMSLEEKVGQLVLCGFSGTEVSAEIRALIAERRIGGVIYFARNVASPGQVAALSEELQGEAAASGTLPLLVTIDQEGGMVARLTEGVALFPGQMAIAAAGRPEHAYTAGFLTGRELRALGINLNFAPVLDVNNNPANPVIGVRSYGESPELVAAYGANAIRGLQDANVAATAKHFPGHGDTNVDSHLDLPVIPHDRERIERVELPPFIRAIAEGVDAIMSTHIHFPAYESGGLPVTLSRAVLTGLLRERLGYEGVIMTDCMEMHAISKRYGTVEAAVMAVEAGADAVLVSHTHELQTGAIDALLAAVRSGRISEASIDRSVERLLALKERRGILRAEEAGAEAEAGQADDCGPAERETAAGAEAPAAEAPLPLGEVGCAEHLAAARAISEASVTLVKDAGGLVPLPAGAGTLVIGVSPEAVTVADDELAAPLSLGRALREAGVPAEELAVAMADIAARREELLERAAQAERLVVATYNAYFQPEQAELVRALQALGKPLAVVALRCPYDLLTFPEVGTYLLAYESRPLALASAARVLAGGIPPRGTLPVTIGEYAAGGGIRR